MSFLLCRCMFVVVFASILGGQLGCHNAGPKLPPTVPVTAKVTLDGKPLEEAEITFSPESSGPASNGQVVDGEVVNLWTNAQKPGVAVGDYRVTIYDQPIEFGGRELVPDKYGRLSEGFTATVTQEGPNEFLFELKRQ